MALASSASAVALCSYHYQAHIGSQGTPFSPYVSDLLGRRATMFIGAVVMLAGVIAQASSTTMQVFVGARVLSMMHIQKVIHILTSISQSA
jgi:MFS family permease